MTLPPSVLRAHLQRQAIELSWPDCDQTSFVPFRKLRGCCPCASCVNEMTGVRTYHESDTAEDVHPQKLDLVGNYAVRITWSDGHNTGLFTWDYLREISDRIIQASS
ncbi:MAG: DUF971 domain-containing protein [Planctomycetaceae bacterium]|nr:DUF971 domain-containing protein [Planctomycetaceae bacterium]